VIVLAHSMGAHILLRFLHDHPRRFAARAHCPVDGLDTENIRRALPSAHLHAQSAQGLARFVFGMEERDPLQISFENNA